MEWIEGIQNAINYIEKNITDSESLEIKLIANQAYSSEYNFRKTFNILAGFSVSDYIRRRRLSLAGEEILLTNMKVIDLAFKYGYETPESFTKAFSRFHGNTPNFVRQTGKGVKSFNPICIKIILEGGKLLDYQIIDKPPITLLGRSKIFGTEFNSNNLSIPAFCKECYSDNKFKNIFLLSNNDEFKGCVLGFRDNLECNADGSELRYTLGVSYEGNENLNGFNIVEIPAMKWVKFKCIGERPKAMQNLWYRVYTEFIPFSKFELLDNITLETCPSGSEATESFLWIPIRQK